MAEERAAARARGVTANTVMLSVILGLLLLVTASGFRGGSVAWMAAAVAQFILVGAWSGMLTSVAGWARGGTLVVLGIEVHLVWFRVVTDLYLALLLALPFTTVFDSWVDKGWQ